MGAGFAFGAGFFNRGVQIQDENREAARQDRKFYMENWQRTVLPEIKAKRATEEAAVSRMNSIFQTRPEVQQNPELAYIAAKYEIENPNKDFFSEFEKNPSMVPQDVYQKQVDNISKMFAYDTDATTGKISGNFRLKEQPQTAPQPIPGSEKKRTLAEILTSKRSDASVMEGARQQFQGATGADPMQAPTNRFNQYSPSGAVPVTPVDKEKQARQKQTDAIMLEQSVKDAKDLGKVMTGWLEHGDILRARNDAGVFTKSQLEADEMNKKMNIKFMESAMDLATNTGDDTIIELVRGGKYFDAAKKGAKSLSEQKAAEQAVDGPSWLKSAYTIAFYKNSSVEEIMAVNKGMSVEEATRTKELATKVFDDTSAAKINDPVVARMMKDKAEAEARTAEANALAANAATKPKEPSGNQPAAAAQATSQSPISPTVNQEQAPVLRPGETTEGVVKVTPEFRKQAETGGTEFISKADPLASIEYINNRVTDKTKKKDYIAALRFTPSDVQKLVGSDSGVYRQYYNDINRFAKDQELVPHYPTKAEAEAILPVGAMFTYGDKKQVSFVFDKPVKLETETTEEQ